MHCGAFCLINRVFFLDRPGAVKGASKRPPQLDPGRRFYKLGEVWVLWENGRNGLGGSMPLVRKGLSFEMPDKFETMRAVRDGLDNLEVVKPWTTDTEGTKAVKAAPPGIALPHSAAMTF